jgi:hypothetical protein
LLCGSQLEQFADWEESTQIALTQDEHRCSADSIAARDAQIAAEKARQQRELETAQQLAGTERLRAEEQTTFAQNLRRRAVYLGDHQKPGANSV